MAGTVVEFTDENFQTDVVEADVPVLVDFWAPWCGPCKALTPTIEELANDFGDKARIGKMNTDENPETPMTHQVSAIPTVILFKGGEVVDKFVGLTPKDKFTAAIENAIA